MNQNDHTIKRANDRNPFVGNDNPHNVNNEAFRSESMTAFESNNPAFSPDKDCPRARGADSTAGIIANS